MVDSTEQQVQIQWLGHATFRVRTTVDGVERVVYFDPWLENPKMPENCKGEKFDDADLILISHGHFDHSASAQQLCEQSTKPDCKIVCIFEIGQVLSTIKGLAEDKLLLMNKGGSNDQGWCKLSMTSADHSSSCGFHEGHLVDGGAPAGWVLRFQNGASIYHAGDTGVFGDMQLIDELYRPTHLLLPIGGNFTMGPEEAAFAVKRFFNLAAHTVIPMHFGTFPKLPGTFEQFRSECEKQGIVDKKLIDSYNELLGKWIEVKA